MAVQEMVPRSGYEDGWEHQETILTGVTGEWVRVQPMGGNGGTIQCSMIAGANTGKIQFTTSPDAEVVAGTANAQDWNYGVVTGSEADSLEQVTAVRGVSDAGTVVFEGVI